MNPRSTSGFHSLLYRRLALPFLALLRMGANPRKLAWSVALGLIVGINPLLGSTTLLCLGLAFIVRLHLAASQIANHVVYPLQIVLVIPFLRLGAELFHTGPIPLSPKSLFLEARTHPFALARALWTWEWHAMVVWALAATFLLPVIAAGLTPIFRRLLTKVQRHEYPLVPST